MTEGRAEIKNRETIKWYEKPSVILLAVIVLGPLAIPLIWRSPVLSKWIKWSATVALIVLTIWFLKCSASLYQTLIKELAKLQDLLRQTQ